MKVKVKVKVQVQVLLIRQMSPLLPLLAALVLRGSGRLSMRVVETYSVYEWR